MKTHFKFTPVLLLLLLLISSACYSAIVDTVETYSTSMNKKIRAVVIRPDNYDHLKGLPVVYLLHGFGGNYSDWLRIAPHIKACADQYQMMIVCADGNKASWYFDSPVDKSWKYETYVASELVHWVDEHYKTIKSRSKRAIAGLSMGGHGAFYLSFKHQDIYGAAGSISGGVDIRPFPNNWHIAGKLGAYADKPDNWEKNTVTNMLYLLTPDKLALIFDCGTDDFFYKVNVELHEKLLERNIPHDFTSRPGAHTSEYWANSIKYQLLFFSNYFATSKE